MEKTNTQISEKCIHIETSIVPCSKTGSGIVPSDRLDQRDQDRSGDLWLSDRFRVSERLNLQGDLAWQQYTKTRDINIYRDGYVNYPYYSPPQTQHFPESYERSFVAPRLGAAYVLGNGATLRGAWQKWLRPASYNCWNSPPPASPSRYAGRRETHPHPREPDGNVACLVHERVRRPQKVDNFYPRSVVVVVLNTRADVTN